MAGSSPPSTRRPVPGLTQTDLVGVNWSPPPRDDLQPCETPVSPLAVEPPAPERSHSLQPGRTQPGLSSQALPFSSWAFLLAPSRCGDAQGSRLRSPTAPALIAQPQPSSARFLISPWQLRMQFLLLIEAAGPRARHGRQAAAPLAALQRVSVPVCPGELEGAQPARRGQGRGPDPVGKSCRAFPPPSPL